MGAAEIARPARRGASHVRCRHAAAVEGRHQPAWLTPWPGFIGCCSAVGGEKSSLSEADWQAIQAK